MPSQPDNKTAQILAAPLTMVEAARLLPPTRAGLKPAPQTVSRLCLKGIKLPDGTRLLLGHIRYNGKLLTSKQEIIAFVEAQQLDLLPPTEAVRTRSPARRKSDDQAASDRLSAMGVK